MRFPLRLSLASLALLATIGCTVGPNYKKPALDLPQSWQGTQATAPDSASHSDWWSVFKDPQLDDYIDLASQENFDLKLALARLDEYHAQLAIASGNRLPQADLSVNAGREGASENGFTGGGTFNSYQIAGNVSWEVDLFGRIRRSIEAANATYQAEHEQVTDVRTSLYADVALTWFEVIVLQNREAIFQQNLDAQTQVMDLTQARVKHGLATDLEVSQAERLLQASRASLPALRAARADASNRLALLLGKQVGELQIPSEAAMPVVPKDVVIGIPADLLRQRPDIRRAERLLAAQTARVGIAHAQLYPSFSISALLGQESLTSGKLFDASSNLWRLGAGLTQPLFHGSRLRNQIKVEDARAKQALLVYEQSVLVALKEVETALSNYAELSQQGTHLEGALSAARRSVTTANRLYVEGLVDFGEVLDAQRRQLEIEDNLIQVKGNHLAALVNLYRALGGGWDPATQTYAHEPMKVTGVHK